jgi:hypothetical protein
MKYLDPPLYQPSNGEPLISSCSQIHTLRVNHLDLSADLAEGAKWFFILLTNWRFGFKSHYRRTNIFLTRAPPTGAGRSTFSYLILNCKQFTKLYILLTCQQIGVNTFYKCIEFQVNSFDSYWEILIILKKYPKCLHLYVMSKQEQITLDIQITGSPALL